MSPPALTTEEATAKTDAAGAGSSPVVKKQKVGGAFVRLCLCVGVLG